MQWMSRLQGLWNRRQPSRPGDERDYVKWAKDKTPLRVIDPGNVRDDSGWLLRANEFCHISDVNRQSGTFIIATMKITAGTRYRDSGVQLRAATKKEIDAMRPDEYARWCSERGY